MYSDEQLNILLKQLLSPDCWLTESGYAIGKYAAKVYTIIQFDVDMFNHNNHMYLFTINKHYFGLYTQ